MEAWDDIIVGAGSAGAVLASRLSEDPARRVLLIEAGEDFSSVAEIPAILKNAAEPVYAGFDWEMHANLRSTGKWRDLLRSARLLTSASASDAFATAAAVIRSPSLASAATEFPYFLGKVVGGSSAVNGAIAMRGISDDFEQWAQAGNPDWGWKDVLPYYKKIETDKDFSGELHGTSGPIPISRPSNEEVYVLQRAFLEACMVLDLPEIADLNDNDKTGVGKVPANTKNHQRISTAIGYLDAARNRSNLKILSRCTVQRVLFDGRRAVAVEVNDDGNQRKILGGRITLSAGTINTTAILQHSGIGNAQLCRSLGITSLIDLPGVGENLSEHAAVVIWGIPKPGVCEAGQHYHQILARISSKPLEPHDLQLLLLSSVNTKHLPFLGDLLRHPLAAGISVMLAQPMSRGRVFISESSPKKPPVIELNLCSDAGDVERLMHGVRMAWKVLHSAQMSQHMERIFLWTDNMIRDDRLLRKAVTNFVSPVWHPVGTAKMGPADDPMAVVNQHFRVHGADNLNVVDASVMPVITRAPTNLTCMMIAERAAEWMMQ